MACTTVPSGQTHERYVSQADIDNFIDNFDDMTNNDDLDLMDIVDFDVPPTAKIFVSQLGDNEQIISNTLKEYGMNRKHPIETFYTILLGSLIMSMDFILDTMMTMIETEEEYEQAMEEMQSNPNFLAFFELKESIHPEDLSLLRENFYTLVELFY